MIRLQYFGTRCRVSGPYGPPDTYGHHPKCDILYDMIKHCREFSECLRRRRQNRHIVLHDCNEYIIRVQSVDTAFLNKTENPYSYDVTKNT